MFFFALPAELRLQIYEELLITSHPIEITPYYVVDSIATGNDFNVAVEGLIISIDHPIYALCHHVSHQMRAEISAVYLRNHFYFAGCWYFVNSLRSIEAELLIHLGDITITWTKEGASGAVEELKNLVNLQILRIRVEIFLKDDLPEDLSELKGIKELNKVVSELPRMKAVLVEWDNEGFLSEGGVKRLEALRTFMEL